MAYVRNADLIRGVLDGGHLQFKMGRKWIDCGGDADTWLSLIVCAGGADPRTHRIKPGSATHGVAAAVAPCTDNPKATCQHPDDCARYGCLAAPTSGVQGADADPKPLSPTDGKDGPCS